MRASAWVVPFLLLLAACQSTGSGGGANRGGPTLIAQEELAELPALTAYQAVERLRPAWLRPRVRTVRGTVPEQYYPQVFLDGVPYGDLDTLNRVNSRDVREIRYFSASEATTRFGTGYPGGVIDVQTKPGGGG